MELEKKLSHTREVDPDVIFCIAEQVFFTVLHLKLQGLTRSSNCLPLVLKIT